MLHLGTTTDALTIISIQAVIETVQVLTRGQYPEEECNRLTSDSISTALKKGELMGSRTAMVHWQ